MKLAAIYNIYDGEELLEGSLKSIRANVDLVIAVTQSVSNFGNINENIKNIVKNLNDKKLIDKIIWYKPNLNISASQNEIIKKKLGYVLAKNEKSTHFFHIDTDEFYDDTDFKKAKELITKYHLPATACTIFNYFKEPIYQMVPKEKFFVPFIHKISNELMLARPYPILADPTRTVALKQKRNFISRLWKKKSKKIDHIYVFTEEQLVMHHYAYVRNDITSKVINRSNRTSDKGVEKFLELWKNWKPGIKIIKPAKGPLIEYDVKKVENKFNINI